MENLADAPALLHNTCKREAEPIGYLDVQTRPLLDYLGGGGDSSTAGNHQKPVSAGANLVRENVKARSASAHIRDPHYLRPQLRSGGEKCVSGRLFTHTPEEIERSLPVTP